MDDVSTRLIRSIGAGARVIVLLTDEEDRALVLLERVGESLGWPVRTWTAASGVDRSGTTPDLDELLERLSSERGDGIWGVFDPAPALTNPVARRRVRELAQRTSGPTLVLVAGEPGRLADIPETVMDVLPIPGLPELREQVTWAAEALEDGGHVGARDVLGAAAVTLSRVGLGLESRDFDRLVAEAVVEHGVDAAAIAGYVASRKPSALDRAGLLEHETSVSADEMGGLDHLVQWLKRRARALDPRARDVGIPPPRGVLLVGVPGCGKSLAARVSATVLGLPLIRLEPGRLFGGTVGESEANLRRVTSTVDRIAPVALWIDEIDKGFAGMDGTASDAGTAARVVGGLLTWLSEHDHPVFVVATANQVDALPPELLRRGRLDEVFFVDLPDAAAREAILRVHLVVAPRRKLGHVPPMADDVAGFVALARSADGYSGAEIEAALTEARLRAFADDRAVAAADFAAALADTVALARSHAETLDGLRHWARTRARQA